MKQQSYFSSNLKFLRQRKVLSQEKLSLELGITRSQLSAYEKGQTKNPTLEMMLIVSEYFKISIDILVKVDLTKITELKIKEYETRSDKDMAGKELRVIVTTVNVNNKPNIEYVPLKAKAGYLSGYGDPEYINKLPVFTLPNLPKDKKFRSFPTEGDSMHPFPENSIIIGEYVDDWFSLKKDVPCIVITKNEGIVFKMVSNNINANRTMLLKSLNPKYSPYNFSVNEICEIWKYKNYISDSMPEVEKTNNEIVKSVNNLRNELVTLIKNK